MSGCSSMLDLPGPIKDSPFPVTNVIKAKYDYAFLWEFYFGDEVYPAIRNVEIVFYGKTKKRWTRNGCVRGSYDPSFPNRVRVGYISDEETFLHQTAFWHELTHYLLDYLYGDADYDHSQGKGPWLEMHDDMIQDLKRDWRLYSDDFSWKDSN